MGTSYYMWYDSGSHKKTRYFVGMTSIKCANPACPTHPKPAWTYEKDGATIFDEYTEALKAKAMCQAFGYKGLQIEPIDEEPSKEVHHDEAVH